ncbi:tRNA (adenosine(37)-N6)-threonylcarbamoyltransferase complex ATPase subunit type 1 TsaE [Alicyclobacillaceae bacterium I2511]|nr:tRNA (adenosine(37)-N6)-threonylcarbamoyltransferase complex ATPase subunit type 1 TsaE [Alicyclobacillaceae bacterium I2511]
MSVTSHSAAETRRLGVKLGSLLEPGDVVCLSGDLGTGKTTFVQGIAAGMGITAQVTSPTFTLVAEYAGRIPLIHMDLYRLQEGTAGNGRGGAAADLAEIGLADYLEAEGAVVVEWPQVAADWLQGALLLQFYRHPLPRLDERDVRVRATGTRSRDLMVEWVKQWLF